VIDIHVLRCGTVGTDETIPDRAKSKNPYAYTGVLRGEKHRVWLPVFTYLIEHPRGRILVDTGWHTDVRTDQKKHLSWQLNIASKAVLPPGEAVTEQLAALGLSPAELDAVLLTHLDVDHASGIGLVRDAKKFFVNAAELSRRGPRRRPLQPEAVGGRTLHADTHGAYGNRAERYELRRVR
jgi:N-acyl homoserine lactone hydrolase